MNASQCIIVERNEHAPLESRTEKFLQCNFSTMQFRCSGLPLHINGSPQIMEIRFKEDWYTFEKSILRVSCSTHYITLLGKDAHVTELCDITLYVTMMYLSNLNKRH